MTSEDNAPTEPRNRAAAPTLREIALLFLKLGTIGFGGPAAHIAMMEDEVVRRRRWLTQEEFLDLLGATNLIPGPNSTEMAIHIGHRQAGFPGLLVAGASFILPAMLLVISCAWAYVSLGTLPQADAVLYGIKPVIIAVVVQALWGLAKTALKSLFVGTVAVFVAVLGAVGVNELALLFSSGAIVAATRLVRERGKHSTAFALPIPIKQAGLLAVGSAAAAGAAVPFGLWPLFLFFLKVGSVLYGSGYVLLVFLRSDLVERFGWLTEAQLLDAVAVGQITPGPVFTTATFIGYILGGPVAALIATLGIFLPAFFFVAVSGPLVPRIRRSPLAGSFLDGVNAASLALMAVVAWQLSRAAVVDWLTITLAAGAACCLLRFKLNSAWLVAGGALVGAIKMLVS
jgi:chromate transporter